MENVTFAHTLKKQLFNTDNVYKILRKTEKKDFIEIANITIYALDTFGTFLNTIPLADREKFNSEIMEWICSVYDDLSRIKKNKKIYARATDKKSSDLKAIEKVIEIVGFISHDTENAQSTYDLLHELHYALENDKDKKILQDRYYKLTLTSKQPMQELITKMVKIYNIRKATKAIDTLVSNLPTYKNIS